MSNGINTFLRLLQGQQQAAPTPMANMQRPYQLPGGAVPPMALSGMQKVQAEQLARGTGGPAPRVLPMLADVAQGKYISPLQKALMQQEAEQPAAGAPAQTTFGQRYAQPTTQALLGAAIQGADASGWSPVPVSTGQVLARMGAGAMQGYEAGKKAELEEAARKAAADKAAFDRRLAIAQYYQKEREIGGVQGEKAFGNEKQLRSEFDKQAKVFDEARLGFEKVQKAAMTKTPTGATDIALIFGYMKVIDPTSVVREGEFATAENAGGIGSKLRNTYNKIVKGERLAPEVRQDFVRAARTQFMPYLDMQKNVEDRYSNLSEAYNLDASKVVLSRLPKTGTLARPYTSFKTPAEAAAAKLPKGTYIQIGNKLYVEE